MQLSTSQAARRVGISSERIRQLADSGELPSTRSPLGRLFDPADVDELLETRRQRRSDVLAFAGASQPGAA